MVVPQLFQGIKFKSIGHIIFNVLFLLPYRPFLRRLLMALIFMMRRKKGRCKKSWRKKGQNIAVLNQKAASFLHLYYWKNYNLETYNVVVTE